MFFAVAVPLFGVYLVTASWGPGYGVDAFTNLQAGYYIANEQTVFIEGDSRVPRPWMAPVNEDRSVAISAPGAALPTLRSTRR